MRLRPCAPSRTRLALLLALLLAGEAAGMAAATINRIVAIVNDEIITASDVEGRLNSLLQQEEIPEGLDPHAVVQLVLRRLIEQRLILQEAKESGLTIGTAEVLDQVEVIRARFGSEAEFRKGLAETGLTTKELKDDIHSQLMVQGIIDVKVRGGLTVSPQEIAEHIATHGGAAPSGERVRTAHILVRVDGTVTENEARGRIEEIHRQITAGVDFSELAAQHSEGAHRDDGGDMGWVAKGQLLPELDAVLFSLKKGEVSDPVETRLGFHLVQAGERRAATSLAVHEANEAVYNQIYQQKFQERFGRWLGGLIEDAYIEIIEPRGR